MSSINNMLTLISSIESPDITVHQQRCVLVRNRNAQCLRCAEYCTSGCLSFDGEELIVDTSKCIGCGTCATVCPTCAIENHNPSDSALREMAHKSLDLLGDKVIFACSKLLNKTISENNSSVKATDLIDPEEVVVVECLGRLDESLLVDIAAGGCKKTILATSACNECEHNPGRRCVEEVVGCVRALTDAFGIDNQIAYTNVLPTKARTANKTYDSGKRAFFSQVFTKTKEKLAASAEFKNSNAQNGEHAESDPASYTKVMLDGTLPHFIPDRRGALLDTLASVGEPEDTMISTRLWGHVIVDVDACTSCRMCATFCPTGAIAKFDECDDEGNKVMGVEHGPADCVKCMTCASICPAHAIEISDEVFVRDLLRGMTDRYIMQGREIAHCTPHTVWNKAKTWTNTDQVYER